MNEEEAFAWKVKAIRKRNDPIEILQFIRDNGCRLHYPLESTLLLPEFTFKDMITECIEGNKPIFFVDKK